MEKFNFPIVSEQQIIAKLNDLASKFEKHQKNLKKSSLTFDSLFDITKRSVFWLSTEDKCFYESQLKSKGAVCYATNIYAPISSIHPSKRIKNKSTKIKLSKNDFFDECNTDSNSFSSFETPKKRRYTNTSLAATISIKDNVSTRKSRKFVKQ